MNSNQDRGRTGSRVPEEPAVPASALSWSGGKDSWLALRRARAAGVEVTHLFNLYEASTGLVRFHGVPAAWIAAQARSLGLPLFQGAVGAGGFEAAFAGMLDRLSETGIEALVFGNIHLADVRAWYETRTRAAGFRHLEPLWGERPADLVREFVREGGRTRVVSVNLECGDPEWLGQELTLELIQRIEAAGRYDVCGEFGEYHTFMFDGPGWTEPLEPVWTGAAEREGHGYLEFATAPEGVSVDPGKEGSGA